MKSIVLFLLVSFSFPMYSFSQLKKAEKLLHKEKYQEALTALKKAKVSSENKRVVLEIQCRSYYGLYRQSTKEYNFEKSLSYALQLLKLDKNFRNEPLAGEINQNLKDLAVARYQKGDQKKSKYYTTTLASSFSDTIELYETFYPKIVKSEASNKSKVVEVTTVSSGNIIRPSIAPLRTSIVQFSERYVGIPYKWGGEDSSGFDCSGFVLCVMRKFNYNFNHSAKDQSELGKDVSRGDLKPGDLVFFGKRYPTGKCKIDHVAMVYSADPNQLKVIHSTSRGVNIQEVVEGDYWSKKLLFYKNIID